MKPIEVIHRRDAEGAGNPQRELTERIIGAGIEVHRVLGPGLLESVYQEALEAELRLEGLAFSRQEHFNVPVLRHGIKRISNSLRPSASLR
jgi:hypothetical protein